MPGAHDPIGAASAGLLAAGVDRHERLFALRVLGLLLDHADHDGRVVLAPWLLASEFALDQARVARAYANLESAGALRPVAGDRGWSIDGYAGYHHGGVNAGDALAMIADLLERPAPPAPTPRRAARAMPVLAGVATVMVLLLGAVTNGGGEVGVALRMAGRDAGRVATTSGDDRMPAAVDDDLRAPRMTTSTVEAAAPEGAPGHRSTPSTADASGYGRPGEDDEVAAAEPPELTPCPAGAPELAVVEVRSLPAADTTVGSDTPMSTSADDPGWYVVIDGTAVNGTDRDAVLRAFDVVIETADGQVVVPALDEPMRLRGGATKQWQIVTRTPLVPGPPDADDVTTVLHDWRWAQRCAPSIDR